MALFSKGKEEKTAAKDELMQKLSSHEYLDLLMTEILQRAGKVPVGQNEAGEDVYNSQNSWLTECQSYYDSRERIVVIEEDLFGIKWSNSYLEKTIGPDGKPTVRQQEDIYEKLAFSYTDSGYRPFHSYQSDNGAVTIATNEVLKAWGEIIEERLQALFPELKVDSSVHAEGGKATFRYYVPALEWKDWF